MGSLTLEKCPCLLEEVFKWKLELLHPIRMGVENQPLCKSLERNSHNLFIFVFKCYHSDSTCLMKGERRNWKCGPANNWYLGSAHLDKVFLALVFTIQKMDSCFGGFREKTTYSISVLWIEIIESYFGTHFLLLF